MPLAREAAPPPLGGELLASRTSPVRCFLIFDINIVVILDPICRNFDEMIRCIIFHYLLTILHDRRRASRVVTGDGGLLRGHFVNNFLSNVVLCFCKRIVILFSEHNCYLVIIIKNAVTILLQKNSIDPTHGAGQALDLNPTRDHDHDHGFNRVRDFDPMHGRDHAHGHGHVVDLDRDHLGLRLELHDHSGAGRWNRHPLQVPGSRSFRQCQ